MRKLLWLMVGIVILSSSASAQIGQIPIYLVPFTSNTCTGAINLSTGCAMPMLGGF